MDKIKVKKMTLASHELEMRRSKQCDNFYYVSGRYNIDMQIAENLRREIAELEAMRK